MNQPLLELRNINLTVSNFKISDISLSLFPGEVHMIMGKNGSGKSMLMELISGMQQPDSGTIYFEGQLVKPKSLSFYSSNELIFIQQHSILIENLSIAENLYFHNLPYVSSISHIELMITNKLVIEYQSLKMDPYLRLSS